MMALNRIQAATPIPNDDDIIEMCYGSEDFKEGMSAFFEKRKPNWQGK
jgi:1,4-dihydroxy-2-naphthoyl-CoA synthase